MAKTVLKISTNLGYGNTDAKAVSVSDFDFEGFEIVLPPVTWRIIDDHARDLLPEKAKTESGWNKLSEEEQDMIREVFGESDGWYEWKDSFNPMMLYYWPLFMHGKKPEAVAELIAAFAPCCTLLEITGDDLRELVGEDYAIVLSGGGMDLSDHIAAAYLCAGSVPPVELLDRLDNTVSKSRAKQLGPALRVAYQMAAESLRDKANRVERTRKKIFSRNNRTL